MAQDLFDLCAPEMHPGAVAVKKAILKWAGAEQSGAVNLVKFLMANTSAWQSFPLSTSSSPPPPGGSNTETESLNLGEFLEAMIEAAEVLRIESIYSALPSNLLPPPPPPPHSSLVTASTSAAPHSNGNGPASVADAPGAEEEEESVKEVSKANGGLEEESVSQGESATIPPLTPEPGKDAEEAMKVGNTKEEVKEEKEEVGGSDSDPKLSSLPHRPSPSSLKLATKLMVEVADVLRGTVKPDTIMVMPTLPFPPPHRVKADQVSLILQKRKVSANSSLLSSLFISQLFLAQSCRFSFLFSSISH